VRALLEGPDALFVVAEHLGEGVADAVVYADFELVDSAVQLGGL
jgi:hypothetical protein